jgi:putative FmdB family regulatory protein
VALQKSCGNDRSLFALARGVSLRHFPVPLFQKTLIMPTYEYECLECGNQFEAVQSMKDPRLTECPKCKGKVQRKIGRGAGIIFKGSGFYQTDYRSDSYKAAAKKDSEGSSGASSTPKESGGSSSSAGGGASTSGGSASPAPAPAPTPPAKTT